MKNQKRTLKQNSQVADKILDIGFLQSLLGQQLNTNDQTTVNKARGRVISRVRTALQSIGLTGDVDKHIY